MDLSVFFAGLLTAASAEQRVRGISEWTEHLGADEYLLPLLDDDAPVVREHAGHRRVVEVRAVALVALQDRRRGGGGWPYGPVTVRVAMRVDEAAARARAALDQLHPVERAAVEHRVDTLLRERVEPWPEDRPACRDYAALLLLGRVPYQRQQVDPISLLTPLQVDVYRSQQSSPRPLPQLRFDGPDGPVGYLYRDQTWVIDVDESPVGRQVRALLGQLARADRDRWIAAVHTSDDELAHLRAVAAEVSRWHPCAVVIDPMQAP